MYRHRFIKIKISANHVGVKIILKEVQTLKHIRLFNEAGTQDPVP
jgi:hypothetical protein